jgi:hypothetical protein
VSVGSYPSIFTLGHKAIANLLDGEVIVEEKVDGSQFSFALREGQLHMRSKGADVHELAPQEMFRKAVETVQALKPLLKEGWTYRGEYLAKPKHNVLVYERHPRGHVMIFDIQTGPETYLSPEDKAAEAGRLGLECVPTLYRGLVESADILRGLLQTKSVLGGQLIEGVVIKPAAYDKFGQDKKCLLGKFVSEAFKETHAHEWTKEHKTKSQSDIVGLVGSTLNTSARWQKALIHLEEAGKLEHSPRDIGLLIGEVPDDVLKECADEIKQALFDWAWPQLKRSIVKGLPDWYKDVLLKRQFEKEGHEANHAA